LWDADERGFHGFSLSVFIREIRGPKHSRRQRECCRVILFRPGAPARLTRRDQDPPNAQDPTADLATDASCVLRRRSALYQALFHSRTSVERANKWAKLRFNLRYHTSIELLRMCIGQQERGIKKAALWVLSLWTAMQNAWFFIPSSPCPIQRNCISHADG